MEPSETGPGVGTDKAREAAEMVRGKAEIIPTSRKNAMEQGDGSESAGTSRPKEPSTYTPQISGSFSWNPLQLAFGRSSTTPGRLTKKSEDEIRRLKIELEARESLLIQQRGLINKEKSELGNHIKALSSKLQERDYEILQLKKEIERGKEDKEYHSRVFNREILKAKEEKALEIERLKTDLQKYAVENAQLSVSGETVNRENQLLLEQLYRINNDLRLHKKRSDTVRRDLEQKAAADQQALEEKHNAINQATMRANERLMKENESLTAYTLDLKKKISDLQSDYDAYVKQTSSMCQAEANRRCKPLQKVNDELRESLRRVEGVLSESQVKFQMQMELVTEEKENTAQQIAIISKDNEELRVHIEKIGLNAKHLNPFFGDDYYVHKFEELSTEIEFWAAKNWKKNSKKILNAVSHQKLLQTIDDFGPMGKALKESLGPQLFSIYAGPAIVRISLIRHIVAVFLFDRIFEPFAIGLDPQMSHNLAVIEDDLFGQGHDSVNLLIIRQAIGRGALKVGGQQPATHPSYKVEGLAEIFCEFFPLSLRKDIKNALTKFIVKAVALKSAMTEEQAIIRCFIVRYGQTIIEDLVDMSEQEKATTGKVLMCTFPGLEKSYLNENGKAKTILVRARAISITSNPVNAEVAPDVQVTSE